MGFIVAAGRQQPGFPFAGAFPINRPGAADASAVAATGCTSRMAKTVYVLNGPSLNLLGTREPQIYGRATLADVEKLCRTTAKGLGLTVEFRQSNHEGEIVDWIQEARAKQAAGLLINPAGYTNTSIAILDALLTLAVPIVEVHISNIHAREPFREHSYVSKAARAVICGFGINGYALAMTGIAAMIDAKD